MTHREIASHRLAHQAIIGSPFRTAAQVVTHLGAMQAQDYPGALWSIGLRLPGSTEAAIEQALAHGEIIRTWPMRGTLHFIAPADARWMLEHLTPRVISASASRHRELQLDAGVFARAEKLFIKALQGGHRLTREDLMALLEKSKIPTGQQRGYHILGHLAQNRVLCFGPRQGKQQTFVLFEEWVPSTPARPREEALAELARRYFTSHGPATVADFAWWSGLKITEARAALAAVSGQLESRSIDARTYWFLPSAPSTASRTPALLPGFDEYLLGYQDRGTPLDPAHVQFVIPGKNGLFRPTMIKGGRVIGTWQRLAAKNALTLTAQPFQPLTPADHKAFAPLARRYGEFLGVTNAAFST